MTVSRLSLLDGFTLEHAGRIVSLPAGMQRLLAFLAVRGPSHRNVVAGTLWPEVPEGQSMGSLRTAVWRLNRLMPGVLEAVGSGLAMTRATVVDVHAQEAFATRLLRERVDDAEWVTRGLPVLWPADLLPGWYDDWVIFERERLAQLRLHALERTAALLMEHAMLDLALQLALEAVRTEPLRETSNAVLIAVYLAEGNTSDALHQYEAFRVLLHREFGLQPSNRLTGMLASLPGVVTFA